WDVESGEEVLPMRSATGTVGLAWSGDGRYLVTQGERLRAWDGGPLEEGRHLPDAAQAAREKRLWHETLAEEAETGRNWYALRFHVEPLLRESPDDLYRLHLRGKSFGESRQWRAAAADAARRIRLSPENVFFWYTHAMGLLGADDEAGYRRVLA